MDIQTTVLIAVVKSITLLLGGSITYFAFKAYRRTHEQSLLALAVGFGVITVGAFFAGIVDQILPMPGSIAILVEGVFTAVGFAIIFSSLYR